MSITLAEANTMANAAIEYAVRRDFSISVSICDENGRLVAHQKMDHCYAEASRDSIGKAIGAAGRRLSGGEALSDLPAHPTTSTVTGSGAPVYLAGGGLPFLRGTDLLGAIGVSGAGSFADDAACAEAGIKALG